MPSRLYVDSSGIIYKLIGVTVFARQKDMSEHIYKMSINDTDKCFLVFHIPWLLATHRQR